MLELRSQAANSFSVRALSGLLLGSLGFAGRAVLGPRATSPASAHSTGSSMTFNPGKELLKLTPTKQSVACGNLLWHVGAVRYATEE